MLLSHTNRCRQVKKGSKLCLWPKISHPTQSNAHVSAAEESGSSGKNHTLGATESSGIFEDCHFVVNSIKDSPKSVRITPASERSIAL